MDTSLIFTYMQVYSIPIFITISVGIALFFSLDYLFGETKLVRTRIKSSALTGTNFKTRLEGKERQVRKKQIEDAIKKMDEASRKESKTLPLAIRIKQAGLDWTNQYFYGFSIVSALSLSCIVFILTNKFHVSIVALFAGGFGLPYWYLLFLKKRRLNNFLNTLPDAVEIIVRGIKSGLPVLDCFKIIAEESVEPVKTEFKEMVDANSLGVPLHEVVEQLYVSMPVAESNFFAITIAIQQKSGGNLGETLGNLSKVLRERKKLKMKISALISEAKASAIIVCSLPFFVISAVYFTNPNYIEILWQSDRGIFLIVLSTFMYSIGLFSMYKMINFEY